MKTVEPDPEPWDTVRTIRALDQASGILRQIREHVPQLRSDDDHGVDPALQHLHACQTVMYASYGQDLWHAAHRMGVELAAGGEHV